MPIIGHYSGLRLGEIVQLRFADISLKGDVPYFDINEVIGDNDDADGKHVKSAAGLRQVPVHPELLNLGFSDFVSERRKARAGRGRVFHEIAFGADGQASSTFSKWFARYLTNIGLIEPGLVFHSFRHGLKDALDNANVHPNVRDQIIGHTDGKTSDGYGVGASLKVKQAAMTAAFIGATVPSRMSLSD